MLFTLLWGGGCINLVYAHVIKNVNEMNILSQKTVKTVKLCVTEIDLSISS